MTRLAAIGLLTGMVSTTTLTVQATLLGPRGRITGALQLVKIQPSPGHSH